jgi:hypothetical protein
MGDLSNFERGQIVGARLAGESVTEIATLLVSKVMSAYMNHGKTVSAKINTDRDHHTLRRVVSKKSQNFCSRCDRTAELNIHLEDPVSTKTV